MKRIILLLIAALGSLLLCGCPDNPYWEYSARSFVLYYSHTDLESISLDFGRNSINYLDIPLGNDELLYHVGFAGGGSCGITSSGSRKIDYDLLCEKHGDVTYNKKIRIYGNELYDERCACDFINLEIWSSAAWDVEHPAGTSLGNIVRFICNTPLPYIRSGYMQKYSDEKGGEYYPVDCLVSELMRDDMTLLHAWGFFICFTTPPTLDKQHTLFVRLTADDGTEFEASLDVQF